MELEHLLNSITAENKKAVAVAAAEDEEVIASVKQAYERGISSFILVGNAEKITFCCNSITSERHQTCRSLKQVLIRQHWKRSNE